MLLAMQLSTQIRLFLGVCFVPFCCCQVLPVHVEASATVGAPQTMSKLRDDALFSMLEGVDPHIEQRSTTHNFSSELNPDITLLFSFLAL